MFSTFLAYLMIDWLFWSLKGRIHEPCSSLALSV